MAGSTRQQIERARRIAWDAFYRALGTDISIEQLRRLMHWWLSLDDRIRDMNGRNKT